MSSGHVDTTIKTAVLANTVFDAVLDATAINAWYTEVAAKIDGNYDEAHADNTAASGSFRQTILNGNCDVCQRFGPLGSKTIATGTSAYVVDRIKSTNNGSGANALASHVAVSDLDGSSYGLQFVHSALPSVQSNLLHFYTMRAVDSYKLAGKQVTIGIKVKGVLAMNQIVLIARYNTTETSITGSSTFIATSSTVTINNTTWTQITLTFTVPSRSTLTTSGVIGFQIAATKTTNEASGDGFIIAQLQNNVGSQLLPFQPRSFAEELDSCLWYYEKSYTYAIAPGSAGLEVNGVVAYALQTNELVLLNKNFLSAKRASPTLTVYSYDGTAGKVSVYNISASVGNTMTFPRKNEKGNMNVIDSGTPFTVGAYYWFAYTADAEL